MLLMLENLVSRNAPANYQGFVLESEK